MKSVHRSFCLFVISGLMVTAGGFMLAAWAVLPGGYPYASTMPPRYIWRDTADRVFVFDGQTGKTFRGAGKDYPNATDVLQDGSWYYYDEQATNENRAPTVAVIEPQRRREVRRFNLGGYHQTFLAGGRYLVSWDGTELTAYDLIRDDSQVLRLKLSGAAISHGPTGMLHHARILAVSPMGSYSNLLVFEIEPSGIKLQASWPIGAPGHIYETGDAVTVVNQAKDGLQLRSLETGEVLERYPLPNGFDLTAADMAFREHYLSTLDRSGVIRHFHAATGQELKIGFSASISQAIPGTSLVICLSREPHDQCAVLVDEATNEVRWTFNVPRSTFFSADITPSGQVWITSLRMGFTAYLLDRENGKVVRLLQPFSWVPWSLVIVCLAAGAWFVSWRRFVERNQLSVWWEVYPLLIWVLGLMTFRMWYVYSPTDFSRIPAAIGYAIVLASLQVAILWVWVGRGRVIDRIVHLVAVFILVGLSFRTLHTPSAYDWPAILFLYCAFPVVSMLLTPLVLSRTRSFQQMRQRSKDEAVREVYSMKTLLAVTTWSALLVMIYGTIMPSLVRIPFAELSYDYFAASAAVAMMAMFAALCSYRLVHRLAAAVAVLLMLGLLAYTCNVAVVGTAPFYPHSTIRFRIISLGLTFSFTFWLVANMRNRDGKHAHA